MRFYHNVRSNVEIHVFTAINKAAVWRLSIAQPSAVLSLVDCCLQLPQPGPRRERIFPDPAELLAHISAHGDCHGGQPHPLPLLSQHGQSHSAQITRMSP